MARRLVSLMLASVLAIALAPTSRAVAQNPSILRFNLEDAGFAINGDQSWTWEENKQRVVGISGDVAISNGKSFITAQRAIVWIDIDEPHSERSRGAIWVDGNVRVVTTDKSQTAPTAVVSFSTLGAVKITTKERTQNKSLSDQPGYLRAIKDRQPPSPPTKPQMGVAPRTQAAIGIQASGEAQTPATAPTPSSGMMAPPDARRTQQSPYAPIIQAPAASNGAGARPVQQSPYAPVVQAPVVANASPIAGSDIYPVQGQSPVAPKINAPSPDPVPGQAGGPPTLEPPKLMTPPIPLPNVNTRKLKISSRSITNQMDVRYLPPSNGDQVTFVTNGVKALITIPRTIGESIVDMEADNVVIWQKANDKDKGGEISNATGVDGTPLSPDKETEFYLSGNVVMRFGASTDMRNPDGSPVEDKVLYASQVYYDVAHNKAIALDAIFLMKRTGFLQPSQVKTPILMQLSQNEWKAERAEISASVLPADPGLYLENRHVTITEQKNQVRRNIFGIPFIDRYTGNEDVAAYRTFEATNSFVDLGGVPIMYFPWLSGNADNPFGPLQNISFQQNTIFGEQFYTTWSVLDLLGIKKIPGENWSLFLDYLTNRGPGFGTSYDLSAQKLFGIDAPFITHVVAYGVYDKGNDNLGGPRETEFQPTAWRDRFLFRQQQFFEDWSYQAQFSYLSDHNFLEAYYNYEFTYGPNQETFVNPIYQKGNLALSFLAEPNVDRPWVTESQWLPKVDAQLLGLSFFDMFTYNTWGSAGYSRLQTYNTPPNELPSVPPYIANPFERPINTARFDWMQQLSMPFWVGDLRVAPYVEGDAAYYTQDYNNSNQGRIYGGAGVRTSLPLSHLYEDVDSEFLNLQGLYHKMIFKLNYFNAGSNTPVSALPQLDRLNDDATQQSLRDITPYQTTYNPGQVGNALYSSPLYDPRLYAIRRLVDDKVDTLGTIEVLQAEIDQRFQTKRGYPGLEHTVDYFTFDISASFYPAANRDNFGHPVSFVEWASTWAIGDRTGYTSNGWFDPFAFGTRYWNLVGYYNRPDGSNFSWSYRQYDPIGSKLVSGSVNYYLSPKYAIQFSASYDLEITSNESTSVTVTRTGTDLTWMVGFSYNAILNNFGFNFMVMPNLLIQRNGGIGNFSPTGGGFLGNNTTGGRQ